VIDAYHGPNHKLSERRALSDSPGLDAFLEFGHACREELAHYREQENLR
jgi:hypothetical protein